MIILALKAVFARLYIMNITQENSLWPAPFSPKSGLYLVPTPIGHLRDMTLRSIDVLRAADLVLCEDKRVSGKLFKAYGIKPPKLLPYHDHSDESLRDLVLEKVKAGQVVALISDAGLPLIADPGYKLVREVISHNLPVTALPGGSSVLTALQLSGLPSDSFSFHGFLPAKAKARQDKLAQIKPLSGSQIVFETAQRIEGALADIDAVLGARPVCLARELSKLYETVITSTAADILDQMKAGMTVKGEIVLVIGGAGEQSEQQEDIEALLRLLLKEHSVKDSVTVMRDKTDLPKKQLYNLALSLKEEKDQ